MLWCFKNQFLTCCYLSSDALSAEKQKTNHLGKLHYILHAPENKIRNDVQGHNEMSWRKSERENMDKAISKEDRKTWMVLVIQDTTSWKTRETTKER